MEPIISEENILLRLKLSEFLACEDGVDEVILSRYNNAIVELKNGRIVSTFRFDRPFTVVQQLRIFFTYQPKLKHYLFMDGSDLIILRKTDVIKIVKIYGKVTNYEIADNRNAGKPHVIIHVADQEAPVVTDCGTERLPSSSEFTRVQTFAPYILKSMLRIKNAERVLHEKTKMISKLSSVLAFNCDDDRIPSSTCQLVFLREGLASAFTGLPSRGNALSVGKPWLKRHLGHWIVGFPLVNISKHDVFSFEMFITHHCVTVKKTILFTKTDSKTEDVDVYHQSEKVPVDGFGVVVGVMEEPRLIPETFNLKCSCRFENSKSDEPEQCFLGSLEVNTSEMGENKTYELFSPHLSANDLMAIRAASKSFELSFKSNLNTLEWSNNLELLLPLRKISDGVFLNPDTTGKFPCLLLSVDPNRNRLRVCANAENDFLLATHKLANSLRDVVTFEHPKNDPLLAVDTALKEMKFIKGVIVHELFGSESSSPSPPVNLEEAFRDMMVLEIDSATAVNSLKMYS